MNLMEHLLEQSVMARQVKRGFWEHFSVNADVVSKACCEEGILVSVSISTYSHSGVASIGKIWYWWDNIEACILSSNSYVVCASVHILKAFRLAIPPLSNRSEQFLCDSFCHPHGVLGPTCSQHHHCNAGSTHILPRYGKWLYFIF